MGGPGSGRKPSPNNLLKKQAHNYPISDNGIVLPDYSGINDHDKTVNNFVLKAGDTMEGNLGLGGFNLLLSANEQNYIDNSVSTQVNFYVNNTEIFRLSSATVVIRNGGQLRFQEGSFQIRFVPPSLSETTTYTLPATDGNQHQQLTTSGGGSLTWTDALIKPNEVITGTTGTAAEDVAQTTLSNTNGCTLTVPRCAVGKWWFVGDSGGNAGTNNHTLNRQGTDTINGGTSLNINSNYGSYLFAGDDTGTNWIAK